MMVHTSRTLDDLVIRHDLRTPDVFMRTVIDWSDIVHHLNVRVQPLQHSQLFV